MRAIEERVTNLEEVLTEFIIQTGEKINATNANVDRLALEMQDFKDEMRDFKDEMRLSRERSEKEMQDFKDEMSDFKDEMIKYREEAERDRKTMGKQWGELTNKMGTIIEDLVFPAVRPVLGKYFNCKILKRNIRNERNSEDGSKEIEIDVIAVSKDKVFMIEVRSKPTHKYVDEVLEKTKTFREFFPEYNDKELIPMLASLVFKDDIINYANKKHLYLMEYREWEYMDIINFDKVKKGEYQNEH